nr:DUF2875 family protein [uncultured Holophaga sp.]
MPEDREQTAIRRPGLAKPRGLSAAVLSIAWAAASFRYLFTQAPWPLRLASCLGPPLLLGGLLVWRSARRGREQRAGAAAREAEEQERKAHAEALEARERFTLEVLGIGIALEHLTQDEAWEALQEGGPFDSILPEDPEDPGAFTAGRTQALLRVTEWLNGEWPLPTFLSESGPGVLEDWMRSTLEAEGSPCRLQVRQSLPSARDLLPAAFAFMDECPDVPAVLLAGEGDTEARPRGTAVFLLLGRRDRLEAMMAFAQSDAARHDSLLPTWEREPILKRGTSYRPTERLPEPWSLPLLERFFALPVQALLHRPQQIPLPEKGDAARAKALAQGWRALCTRAQDPEIGPLLHGAGHPDHHTAIPYLRALTECGVDRDLVQGTYDLQRRIGDTGPVTGLLGNALAGLAVASGEVAAWADLVDPDQALLLLARPPEEPPA